MNTPQTRYKISHVIDGLPTGGAETTLFKLLSKMDPEAFDSRVLSFTEVGAVGEKIRGLGIPVHALNMHPKSPNPVKLLQLLRWVRRGSPDVVQTWMYNADLMGGLSARLASKAAVVWNIRHSVLVRGNRKGTAFWTAKACARLARWMPRQIVSCSANSRDIHIGAGYPADKMLVIPNGYDLDQYRPDPIARADVRQGLGVSDETVLIGLVARFRPEKDHATFFRAAAQLAQERPEVHFLLCGIDIDWQNEALCRLIQESGIADRCSLIGERSDIPRVNASLDIATSSSYSEGFSNTVGEAMACGVPCVVTDVGDSARIVAETGVAVPASTPEALATGWKKLVDCGAADRKRLGDSARERVRDNYSLDTMVDRYERLYEGLVSGRIGEGNERPSPGSDRQTWDQANAAARDESPLRQATRPSGPVIDEIDG